MLPGLDVCGLVLIVCVLSSALLAGVSYRLGLQTGERRAHERGRPSEARRGNAHAHDRPRGGASRRARRSPASS